MHRLVPQLGFDRFSHVVALLPEASTLYLLLLPPHLLQCNHTDLSTYLLRCHPTALPATHCGGRVSTRRIRPSISSRCRQHHPPQYIIVSCQLVIKDEPDAPLKKLWPRIIRCDPVAAVAHLFTAASRWIEAAQHANSDAKVLVHCKQVSD